jgi:hypothetical protein
MPWQDRAAGYAFGSELEPVELLKCAPRIRTYNEEIENSEIVQSAKNAISKSLRLIFLGFHFHKQNCDLIALNESQKHGAQREVFATTCARSAFDIEIIRGRLRQIAIFHSERIDNFRNCNEIFKEFASGWC